MQLGFSHTEELNKRISLSSSALFFKNHDAKVLFPVRKNKGNEVEFLPNEVPKVQAVKNHGALFLISQIYTPNKELNKHLK